MKFNERPLRTKRMHTKNPQLTNSVYIMSMQYTGDVQYTGGYHEYTGSVQYIRVSIQIQLFSQWPSPTFIMISPQCTHDIPHCTHVPGVLNIYRCTAPFSPPPPSPPPPSRCTAETSCRMKLLLKISVLGFL